MLRRLYPFLRPHLGRLAGTIACNLGAALLDVFSLTLLIPFLNAIFDQPAAGGAIGALQQRLIGPFLDAADKMGSLRNIMVVIRSRRILPTAYAITQLDTPDGGFKLSGWTHVIAAGSSVSSITSEPQM